MAQQPITPSIISVPQPKVLTAGLVLVLLSAALFFSNIGAHDLWGPDEVRYALVAREMRDTGDYMVPHLNGETYLEKPPLMFWLSAWLAERIAGRGEATSRLPSALAALATVLLVWRFTARRWDEWTGLVAGVILATSVQFFWFGRSGGLEALLTLCVTVSLLSGVKAIDSDAKWPPWVLGVGAGLAAGILTKGPVAVLFALMVLGPYGWMTGRGRRAAAVLAAGIAVALLLVWPWWRAAYEGSGGEYGNAAELWRQTRGRAFNSYSHQKPFYHYAVGIFGEFAPWAVFLPGALWAAYRARGSVEWPRLRVAWCWILPPFLVFSALSGKRGQYLLPIYPGLAMLVAAYWRQHAANMQPLHRVRAILVPSMVLAGGMILGGTVLMLLPWWPMVRAEGLVHLARPAVVAGIAIMSLGWWGVLHHLDRPPSRILATIVVVCTILYGLVAGVCMPVADHFKSARNFATRARVLAGTTRPVVLFHSFRADIAYYYGGHLRVEGRAARIADYADAQEPVVAIMREKHYHQVRNLVPDRFVIMHRERIGSRIWLLLTNEPPVI